MRFLFVSKIHKMSPTAISGQIVFGGSEPWRYRFADGSERVSVSVISEAIGQLVSWQSLKNTDFFGRPVFLFASSIELSSGVPVGSTVQLAAEITNESQDSFVFSGRASLDGQIVAQITDCGGYLMPLAELEDPAVTRERLEMLTTAQGVPVNPEGPAFNFPDLIDQVKSKEESQSITAVKTFSNDEPFYVDHFPRFPVTPIVVINEMIAEATARMMSLGGTTVRLVPVAVQDLKIKSFIRPGDQATVSVKKIEDDGKVFETIAEISLGGRRILRGRYRYLRS